MKEHDLLKDKRILIVDDEPDVLDTLEDLLPDSDLTRATDFEQADALLRTREFDLAILDIMGVAGYDLLKTAVENDVTAVMLTARALGMENVMKSFRQGAAYYVPKEEMVNIATYLEDILEAKRKGKNTWERWMDRLGAYCERHFGPEWQKDSRILWEKFPFH